MAKSLEPHAELDDAGRRLYFKLKRFIGEDRWEEEDSLLTNQACLAEQRARDARGQMGRDFTEVGSRGQDVASPLVGIVEKAERLYVDCLKELGLTPRARAQFGGKQEKTGDDPLSKAFEE